MIHIHYLEQPSLNIIKKFKKKIKFVKISKYKQNNKKVTNLYVKLENFIGKNILDKFDNLKCVLSPTTGDNHIDRKYLKKNNIRLIKLSTKNKDIKKIYSTGEYTLSLILNSVRKIFNYRDNFINDIFDRYYYKVFQFRKYTIGIIGLGRVGRYLKKNLNYLKFKIITFDISTDKKSKLKLLLKKSDIVSLCIPSDNNSNFIDTIKLKYMKKNAILINTSRGEIINENQLLSHLKKNKNFFAVLDVIKKEQKKRNQSLIKYNKIKSNLVILPHVGGSTIDSMEIADNYIIDQVIKNYEKKK